MLLLRSTLFQVLFYTVTFVEMILFSPVMLLPRKWGWPIVPFWSKTLLWLMRYVAGLKVEIRGRENLPDGGYIAAMKHQSAWETVALIPLFKSPTFILKRELRWIPIFGWYTAKYRQIPINRGKRSEALAAMMEAAKERGLCRMIVINKFDLPDADLEKCLEELRETWGPGVLPINLPTRNRTHVIDCFDREDGDSDIMTVEDVHRAFIERVAASRGADIALRLLMKAQSIREQVTQTLLTEASATLH